MMNKINKPAMISIDEKPVPVTEVCGWLLSPKTMLTWGVAVGFLRVGVGVRWDRGGGVFVSLLVSDFSNGGWVAPFITKSLCPV